MEVSLMVNVTYVPRGHCKTVLNRKETGCQKVAKLTPFYKI